MEHYGAIDVSLEWSSVCVVDAAVRSSVKPRRERARGAGRLLRRSAPCRKWLHAGLVAAGLPAILIETRHVKAALQAMT
jgi:hypothetical protein